MAILSVELITFTLSIWMLMTLKKKKYPEIFFPPSGVVVFRSPEAEDLKNIKESKDQIGKNPNRFRKPKEASLPIRIQHASARAFENIRFMADLELAIMMTYVIIFVSVVSFTVHHFGFLPQYFNAPTLSFYLTLSFLLVFIYQLVRIAAVGGLQIYENRLSVIISFLSALLLFVLLIPARGILSIQFERAFKLQYFHIRAILHPLSSDLQSFSVDSFLMVFILLFSIFVYSFVPVILKYGNSYIGMMKENYKLEAQYEMEQLEIRKAALRGEVQNNGGEAGNQEKGKLSETEKQFKETKSVLKWFNLGLVFHFLVLFCWIKPITDTWNSFLQDNGVGLQILRVAFPALHIFTFLFTYKSEISRYMLRVYDTITSLLKDPSPENLRAVRTRTDAHLSYMGVMSYQVMMKIIIPFFLLILFFEKQSFTNSQSKDLVQAYTDPSSVNFLDWNSYVVTDPLEILGQGSVCPKDKLYEIVAIRDGFGVLDTAHQYKSEGSYAIGKDILRKMQKYGLIHNEFWSMMISTSLFLYYLVTYILAIIYIFYRKAIEQV